jgi:predicted ATP-dependent endonuclease of OLD family
VDIADAIRLKLRAAAESGTPFMALDGTKARRGRPVDARQEAILVEGRFDERIITTLIQAWGTRPERQSVVPVGGASNFAPSAEALLAQSDEGVRLVVVADGDTAAMKQRINNDLAQRAIKAKVLVVEPNLEAALGLFEPGEFARGRRKVLNLDDRLLLSQIRAGIESGATDQKSAVDELFKVLGINPPSSLESMRER